MPGLQPALCLKPSQPLLMGDGMSCPSFPFCALSEHKLIGKILQSIANETIVRSLEVTSILISNFLALRASLCSFILPFGRHFSWYHRGQGLKVCLCLGYGCQSTEIFNSADANVNCR